MANTVNKVIEVALAEVGYLEKSAKAYYNNPSVLDDKTSGAGYDNYTKYGRDMHKVYPTIMDFPAYWCDSFVDWCFYKAYGISTAKSLLGGNFDDYTVASAQMYKNKNAWYSYPKIGDQVFFKNSTRICHTGIVYNVDSNMVYTIEGNTSGASGVTANGGGVCKKSYPIGYYGIAGYGRPNYDVNTNTEHKEIGVNNYMFSVGEVKKGSKGKDVRLLQRLLKSNGCKGKDNKYLKIDGESGENTDYAIRYYQKKKKLTIDGVCGPKTWKSILIR